MHGGLLNQHGIHSGLGNAVGGGSGMKGQRNAAVNISHSYGRGSVPVWLKTNVNGEVVSRRSVGIMRILTKRGRGLVRGCDNTGETP